MNIDIFSYSNVGARPLNEDSYAVKNNEKRMVAVVCDGLGGHDCGEVASKIGVESIMSNIFEPAELDKEKIAAIVKKANLEIIKQQSQKAEQKGMRTTVVGCVVENNEITSFNCGDSRFYFFSDGELKNASRDHSVSQMSVDMGEKTRDEIRFDRDRNKLLRVLGDKDSDELATVYKPQKLKKGDAFLLCSDGFWEYVTEHEMEIDLAKSHNAHDWISYMIVRLLLQFSKENDNFTVIGGIVKE